MDLSVPEDKVDWAVRTVNKYIPQLEEGDILSVIDEIGEIHQMLADIGNIQEAISYTPDGNGFQFAFTDLQLIAFAAVLASVGEVFERE